MASILILGGGFGGLIAAERLSAALASPHQVTLVSPSRKFTFYPALVHLAFGECEPDDITFDLADKLKDLGVRFVQGETVRIDKDNRSVEITGEDFSGEIGYDYLVIAPGRRLATEKVPGFFEYAHHLLGVNAALKFGEAIRAFRKGEIIVGLCPEARLPVPVCEAAFALAKKFQNEIHGGDIHIKVIFPESLATAFGGASLHKELEDAFQRHGINVLYDIRINEITSDEVLSTDGHRIRHDLLMLVPPFRGHSMLRVLGTDDFDFVKVDGKLRIRGLDRAYAAGDIVAFSGPKFAHMAVRQANVAATNLIAEINGKEPNEEYYHEIATIINAGGPDSIYLHYGIWDDRTYRLKKGAIWGRMKDIHDSFWQARHE
jgi:sulfide:quinone oxidoreductase